MPNMMIIFNTLGTDIVKRLYFFFLSVHFWFQCFLAPYLQGIKTFFHYFFLECIFFCHFFVFLSFSSISIVQTSSKADLLSSIVSPSFLSFVCIPSSTGFSYLQYLEALFWVFYSFLVHNVLMLRILRVSWLLSS